jgi:hypothetical protein
MIPVVELEAVTRHFAASRLIPSKNGIGCAIQNGWINMLAQKAPIVAVLPLIV